MNDEFALLIGRHVLDAYDKWTKNPQGSKIIIPIVLPHSSDIPPWTMNIECDMPRFIEHYWENGERKVQHWSFKEWHESSHKPNLVW